MVSWHRGATPPQFFVERHLPEDPGDQLLDPAAGDQAGLGEDGAHRMGA